MNPPEPFVRLYGHVGLGLIICWPSGIRYTTQTMGYHCAQPYEEGVFVSLRNDCVIEGHELKSPERDLWDYFTGAAHGGVGAPDGLDGADADFIDSVLARHKLGHCLRVARERLADSNEAWVHVEVLADENPESGDFGGFGPYPRAGILTWTNSD